MWDTTACLSRFARAFDCIFFSGLFTVYCLLFIVLYGFLLFIFLLGFLCWTTNDLTTGADWTGATGFSFFHFVWEATWGHGAFSLGISYKSKKHCISVYWMGGGGLGFTVYGCLNSAYMGGIASALSLFVFCLFLKYPLLSCLRILLISVSYLYFSQELGLPVT